MVFETRRFARDETRIVLCSPFWTFKQPRINVYATSIFILVENMAKQDLRQTWGYFPPSKSEKHWSS